jgi:hypothetical protein
VRRMRCSRVIRKAPASIVAFLTNLLDRYATLSQVVGTAVYDSFYLRRSSNLPADRQTMRLNGAATSAISV